MNALILAEKQADGPVTVQPLMKGIKGKVHSDFSICRNGMDASFL